MSACRDADVGVDPALAEGVELVEQRLGVHHTAVPEDADLVANGAARDERELVLLAAVDDGVAGVVAALVPDHDVRRVTVDVDDPALPFVAELRADDGYGHQWRLSATGVNRLRSRAPRPTCAPRQL